MNARKKFRTSIWRAGAWRRPSNPFPVVAAAASLVAALSLAGAAQAGTIQVSNTDQLVSAVASAGSGDTIVLAAGIYNPDTTLVLGKNVTLTGPSQAAPSGGPSGAIISGASVESPTSDVIDISSGASVTLQNLSIRLTDVQGAAIDVSGQLELDNSELSANSSLSALVVEIGATANVVNSTIAVNSGDGVDNNGTATFVNDTISGNHKAGIFDESGSTTSLSNTIVSRNGNGTTYASDCVADVTSSSSSLDGDGSCGANMHTTAGLGALENNGGPTLTMALLPGSAAINAGSSCPSTDQRHASRSGGCDIGSFAFSGTPPAAAGSSSGSSPASSGSQPASPSSSSPSSSSSSSASGSSPAPSPSAGSTTAPAPAPASKPATTVTASTVVAHGAFGKGRAAVTISLRATAGKHAGLLVVTDAADGVRLRATSVAGLSIDSKHKTATLRGQTLNLASHRKANFVIVVSGTGHVAVSVTDAKRPKQHPVHRSGNLTTGNVFIA
jgi:hypothetical protein